MIGRLFVTIALAMIIPAFGWLTAARARLDLGVTQVGADNLAAACDFRLVGSGPCARLGRYDLLQSASLWSGVLLVAALVAVLLAARYAGVDRRRNAAVFPPLAPIATGAVAIGVALQAAVVTAAAAIAGAPTLVVWVVGFAALIAAATLVAALRAANQDQPAGVLARAVSPDAAPRLWSFVGRVAEDLGADRPRNILVGLDPTFFATAAPISVPERDQPLTGETMYLSLPLMRLFTEQELRAVVAHELGHFCGEDTRYSLRFAPIYRRLGLALHALSGGDGRFDNPLTWPAASVLSFMHDAFASNERAIGRARELAADEAAVRVAGPKALGLSLAKVAVYAPLWTKIRAENADRLGAGRVTANLSKTYADAARYDVSHQLIDKVLDTVLAARLAHPTDSHPPLSERYAEIGFDAGALTLPELTEQGDSGFELFDDLERIERELTLIEHKVTLGSGAVAPTETGSEPREEAALNAAYVLAATMVMADGQKHDDEVRVAEEIGARLFPGFDAVGFRETFDNLDELPPFRAAVHLLGDTLAPRDRARVHAYLTEIAAVDGLVDADEQALLDLARQLWGVRRPITVLGRRVGGGLGR